MQGDVAAQSKMDFGLSSGRGSGVDRRDPGFASKEGNDAKAVINVGSSQRPKFPPVSISCHKPLSAPDPAKSLQPKHTETRVRCVHFSFLNLFQFFPCMHFSFLNLFQFFPCICFLLYKFKIHNCFLFTFLSLLASAFTFLYTCITVPCLLEVLWFQNN